MKKILIVVDMQNDFIYGALGTKEAVGIVDKVADKMRAFSKEDIFVTLDTHGADYADTLEGKLLPVPHCIKGTKGWELAPAVAEAAHGARVFEKPGFGSTELTNTMKELWQKEEFEIELIGLCTDICVVTNALMIRGALPNAVMRVDASCCAGVTPEKHEAALETLRSCQIEVV